ncbi:MAG: helix-turn-helix domain-containing protein [Treponemataceae bacterium]|nr:helix-turn-helix domain-containing protein [Treponemataceae bacterium]
MIGIYVKAYNQICFYTPVQLSITYFHYFLCMEDVAKGFKQRLSDELSYKGFGIKEFAAKVGISVSTLNMYLYRNSIPAADVAVKMAKVLNVTTEYLITGEESKTTKAATELQAIQKREIYYLIESFQQKQLDSFLKITRAYKEATE